MTGCTRRAASNAVAGGFPGTGPINPRLSGAHSAGFETSVRTFAGDINIPFHTFSFSSIDEISRTGFYAWQWLFFLLRIQPGAVLVESGPQMNPVIGRRSPVLPLWMPSTCSRSHALLQEILPDFPPEIPVLFQAWPAVQLTPDVIPAKIWNFHACRAARALVGRRSSSFPQRFLDHCSDDARYRRVEPTPRPQAATVPAPR